VRPCDLQNRRRLRLKTTPALCGLSVFRRGTDRFFMRRPLVVDLFRERLGIDSAYKRNDRMLSPIGGLHIRLGLPVREDLRQCRLRVSRSMTVTPSPFASRMSESKPGLAGIIVSRRPT
jgi:hypothetical protein